MSRRTIQLLVILSTLSIIGIIVTQVYWVKKAFDLRMRQFDQSVHISLQEVAEQIGKLNGVMVDKNPVEQLSSDYFIVNTNSTTDPVVLEHYLKTAFLKHDLITDFDVGIYDCTTNKIRFGTSLSTRNDDKVPTPTANWLLTNKFPYYFSVRFPREDSYLASQLNNWIVSSMVILIAIGFFGYALWVILRQKQLHEIQKDFFNNMTHELQTPISTIKIAADVLATPQIKEQPERMKKYIQIVQQEVQRLQSQVEMVLNVARAERNALTLQKQPIDVHQLVASIADRYDGIVRLHLNASESVVSADLALLTSVVSNLIDNAVKYSPENPEISVHTENLKGIFLLSVKDNGLGIAQEYQGRVFDKFYRVPTGNIHNVKGFGLGLSYVQQIIKTHGWKLELRSEAGKGSEFKVLIPK